jgi:phytoene desaturase
VAQKIAVVGAGVGGLSCAARLAKKGHAVQVFEKLPVCGGRNNLLEDKGFKFDMGPSFVLMPDFFEEVFSYCGENIRDYLDLRALDTSYKIFYPDGVQFTVFRDSERTKEEAERLETGGARAFDAFVRETERLYREVRPLLYRCFTARDLWNPRYWGLIGKIRALESYWSLAGRFFKSDKLRYAFTFEAMFMGVSPFQAPAFYSVISYADHVQKIAHPMGGMYRIPLALEKMARKFGAQFEYGAEISRIRREAGGIVLEKKKGGEFKADTAVVNADYAFAQTDLLQRKISDYRYSCSVYLMYLGLKKKVSGLEHHNLFFSSDLEKNLRQIFEEQVMPEDPSFYIHVPTVTDTSLAPEGKEIMYVLVPIPNLCSGRNDIREHQERIRRRVFDKVRKASGTHTEGLIEVERTFFPEDFIRRYNIQYGATFGLAHNLMQSAFFRPANFDPRIKGFYYVGASTQPGGGLPVVMAGSRIVADLISKNTS